MFAAFGTLFAECVSIFFWKSLFCTFRDVGILMGSQIGVWFNFEHFPLVFLKLSHGVPMVSLAFSLAFLRFPLRLL